MLSRPSSSVAFAFAVHLAILFASVPAHAQQATAYQTLFDTADGWDLSEYYGVTWGVDNSPIGGYSAATSLNFNNGTNYDTGDFVYGLAISPFIDISGAPNATLRFRCRFQTETPSLFPVVRQAELRWLFIFDAAGEILALLEFAGDGSSDVSCGAMDMWHEHSISLNPAWGTIVLGFYFDSNDEVANNFQGWFIDNLAVEIPDVTPPATVTNLAAGAPTLNSLTVTWSSPSDDDVSGVAASFDLRTSLYPITAATFAAATPVNGEPAPAAAGTPHQLVVTGLSPSTTQYFALRTTDKAGNVSALSNVASATTLAPTSPPGSPGSSSTSGEVDNYKMCGAGTVAGPAGLLAAWAGLLAIAAMTVKRRK